MQNTTTIFGMPPSNNSKNKRKSSILTCEHSSPKSPNFMYASGTQNRNTIWPDMRKMQLKQTHARAQRDAYAWSIGTGRNSSSTLNSNLHHIDITPPATMLTDTE